MCVRWEDSFDDQEKEDTHKEDSFEPWVGFIKGEKAKKEREVKTREEHKDLKDDEGVQLNL